MSKKQNIQDMLEAHLDKIVLGLIGLISMYLLWAFVLGNPYGAQVAGRKIGPGRIDLENRQQANQLEDQMAAPAPRREYDLRLVSEFEDLLRISLPQLGVARIIPLPGAGEELLDDDRVYPTPEIVALTDVQVAVLRGAVFKPVEEVSPDIPYDAVETELADLDLVSISGRINVATLYQNFQQSFNGPRLNASWREPAFAKPVIARLELQRRQKHADGSWSEWNTLPPTQIDPFRKLKEQTPMTTEAMEFGGVMLWLKQYEDPRMQVNLLQPAAYDFASGQTGWLPPKYLDETQTILRRQEEELRRQLREERLRARETGGDEMTGGARQPATRTPTRTQPQPQPRGGLTPEPTPPRTAAAARRERTLEDVQRDLQQERIDEQTKLENRRDPLLVWTHDDTARPGETYQYRVRLGVFNPIAGRNWFRDDQRHNKNQVVLWSAYSEPTNPVEIPKMLHLFPTDMLVRETGNGVKVEVARYYLGQWRTREFEVFPGQTIGQRTEYLPPAPPAARPGITGMGMEIPGMEMARMGAMQGGMDTAASSSDPQTVDFTTPYMLVDINSHAEWVANFSNRSEYWQMLYYGPDQAMLAMPVGSRNWPSDMRRQQEEIKNAEQNAMPLNMTRTTAQGMSLGDTRMTGGMGSDLMMRGL